MVARLGRRTSLRVKKQLDETRARDRCTADYEGAMHAARQAMRDLQIGRGGTAPPESLRNAHARLDDALGKAAAAAAKVHASLFAAAGGVHHAEVDADVALWKRRMNTALTLRSKHQLAVLDEGVWLESVRRPRPRTRAAFGPHQAGMDFEPDLGDTLVAPADTRSVSLRLGLQSF